MYKLDGKLDAIELNIAEIDNALNSYKAAKDKLQEEKFMFFFRNYQSREAQAKIYHLITNPDVIEEFGLMLRVIDKNLNKEKHSGVKGLATYLMTMLLSSVKSQQFWKKLFTIIGNPDYSETLNAFNTVLYQKSLLVCMTDVIEEYLKSLCQVDEDQFYIDLNTINDKKKLKLISSIEVPQIILIIHHLLNHPSTSQYIFNKVFETFELNPAFKKFLKLTLRNFNL